MPENMGDILITVVLTVLLTELTHRYGQPMLRGAPWLFNWYLNRTKQRTAKAIKTEIETLTKLEQNAYELSAYAWTQLFSFVLGVVITLIFASATYAWTQIAPRGLDQNSFQFLAVVVFAGLLLAFTLLLGVYTVNIVQLALIRLSNLRNFDLWVARQRSQLQRMGVTPD